MASKNNDTSNRGLSSEHMDEHSKHQTQAKGDKTSSAGNNKNKAGSGTASRRGEKNNHRSQ